MGPNKYMTSVTRSSVGWGVGTGPLSRICLLCAVAERHRFLALTIIMYRVDLS